MISCDHCKMVFKYNCHLDKHLSRKFPCFTNIPTEVVINNIPYNTIHKVNMYNKNDTSRENMITKKCDIVNDKIENDNQNTRCYVCLKTFSRKDALDRHVSDGCKLLKDDVRTLELKLNKVVSFPSDNMSCRFCKQVFAKGKYLKPHYDTCKKRKGYLNELNTALKELEDNDVDCRCIEQPKKPMRQNFSQSMRLKIAYEQDWKCGICIEKLPSTFQVDHIVPVFRGGNNSRENGMALCVSCHATKTQNENIERHK
jgi:5-methylcytosine-specific restriction endonuclease McrA